MAGYGRGSLCVTLIFLCFLPIVCSQNNTTTQASSTITTTTIQTSTVSTTTTTQAPTDAPTPIPPNTDVAVCTCDLTANACDVNCCCDVTDCTSADISAFSKCIDAYTPPDRQVCVQRSIIFADNTPLEKNLTDPSLFCVIRDNYAQRNYYDIPTAVDTEQKFDQFRQRYGGPSYLPVGRQENIPKDYYRSGDPIYIIYSSLVLGKLGLPRAMVSEECVDNNPAAFFVDHKFECVRSTFTTLQKQCASTLALSARSYYKDFRLIKNPKSVAEANKNLTEFGSEEQAVETMTNLYNSSLTIEIELAPSHVCIDRLGIIRDCAFTSDTAGLVDDNGKMYCVNAVIKVEYMLEHNGTAGISAAQVRFTFAELSQENLPASQTFSTMFTKMGDTTEPFQRSGNPGYQIGEPLLAGQLSTQILPDETTRKTIDLNTDRDNWLTIASASVQGTCDGNYTRIPVTFGENLRSGCNLILTYSNFTSKVCNYLQSVVIQTLLGASPPTHVAMFGNSSPEKTGDWVKILEENRPEGVTDTAVGCGSISMGLHLEVMYASVGALGNPQPKIIGVNHRWEDPKELLFQCSGPYCLTGSGETLSQSFEVVSSVAFIDASNKANGVDAETPQFTAKLPEDFFYPFT